MLTKILLGCIAFAFIASLSLVIISVLNDIYASRIQYLRSESLLFKEYFRRRSIQLTILYFVLVFFLDILLVALISCITSSVTVIGSAGLSYLAFSIGLYVYRLQGLKSKNKKREKPDVN